MARPRAAAASVFRAAARLPSLRTTRHTCWSCMGSASGRWRGKSKRGKSKKTPENAPGFLLPMRLETPLALFLALLAWWPCFGQTKAADKAAASPPDYAKEAFVIERVSTRVAAEDDGMASRE